jgi:hypothetical protein
MSPPGGSVSAQREGRLSALPGRPEGRSAHADGHVDVLVPGRIARRGVR